MNYGYRGGFYGPYGYAPPRPIRGMGPPGPGPRPLMGPQMRPRWGAAFASLNNGGFDPYSRGPGPQQQQNFCDEFDPETEDVPMHLVTSDHVKDWLGRQHPMVVREVMFHARWLLEKMGVPADQDQALDPSQNEEFSDDTVSKDLSSWYAPFKPVSQDKQPLQQLKPQPASKKGGN